MGEKEAEKTHNHVEKDCGKGAGVSYLSWSGAQKAPHDRSNWRSNVKALCVTNDDEVWLTSIVWWCLRLQGYHLQD